MKLRLPHIALIVLALLPGYLGVALVTNGPTEDTSSATFVALGVPLIALALGLITFAVWAASRRR